MHFLTLHYFFILHFRAVHDSVQCSAVQSEERVQILVSGILHLSLTFFILAQTSLTDFHGQSTRIFDLSPPPHLALSTSLSKKVNERRVSWENFSSCNSYFSALLLSSPNIPSLTFSPFFFSSASLIFSTVSYSSFSSSTFPLQSPPAPPPPPPHSSSFYCAFSAHDHPLAIIREGIQDIGDSYHLPAHCPLYTAHYYNLPIFVRPLNKPPHIFFFD